MHYLLIFTSDVWLLHQVELNWLLEIGKVIYEFTTFPVTNGNSFLFLFIQSLFLNALCSASVKEVHDAEILTLDYSSHSTSRAEEDKKASSRTLLATASRDRLVHVFDATSVRKVLIIHLFIKS